LGAHRVAAYRTLSGEVKPAAVSPLDATFSIHELPRETVWKFLRTRTLEFLGYENGAKEDPFCLSILLSRLGQETL
jgi:hypothetical protein